MDTPTIIIGLPHCDWAQKLLPIKVAEWRDRCAVYKCYDVRLIHFCFLLLFHTSHILWTVLWFSFLVWSPLHTLRHHRVYRNVFGCDKKISLHFICFIELNSMNVSFWCAVFDSLSPCIDLEPRRKTMLYVSPVFRWCWHNAHIPMWKWRENLSSHESYLCVNCHRWRCRWCFDALT